MMNQQVIEKSINNARYINKFLFVNNFPKPLLENLASNGSIRRIGEYWVPSEGRENQILDLADDIISIYNQSKRVKSTSIIGRAEDLNNQGRLASILKNASLKKGFEDYLTKKKVSRITTTMQVVKGDKLSVEKSYKSVYEQIRIVVVNAASLPTGSYVRKLIEFYIKGNQILEEDGEKIFKYLNQEFRFDTVQQVALISNKTLGTDALIADRMNNFGSDAQPEA